MKRRWLCAAAIVHTFPLFLFCATVSESGRDEREGPASPLFKCPEGTFLLAHTGRRGDFINGLEGCLERFRGSYEEMEFLKRVKGIERAIRRCLRKGVKPVEKIYGEVVVKGRIDPSGNVSSPEVAFSSIEEREVEGCIASTFLRIRGLKGFDQEGSTFLFPVVVLSESTPSEVMKGIVYKNR